MSLSPQESFESFLAQLIGEKWITSYVWSDAPSQVELKSKLGKQPVGWSRSHKLGAGGTLWGIDVEASPGTVIGVDLELVADRPILQNPQWLANRFNLPPGTWTPRSLLEEWVCREAVFKACAPENQDLMLSSFCKTGPMTYGLLAQDHASLVVETKVCWSTHWVMALAQRITQ